MTKPQAHRLLTRASRGQRISRRRIKAALRVTGDMKVAA